MSELVGNEIAVSLRMALTKILCPIDFSPGSQHAMHLAIRLANDANAELVLTHAWHLPITAYADLYQYSPQLIEQTTENAARGLDDAMREATQLGAKRVTSKLLRGVPWQAIVDTLAQDHAFDLVVMGTQGLTGLSRVLLGSVAQDVVRHAPCSVLVVHPGNEPKSFGRVLCPIDFSESSHDAIEIAAALARSEITLVHAVELPISLSGGYPVPDVTQELTQLSTKLLDDWAARLRSRVEVPVVTRTQLGSPGAQTLALLDEDPSFDLVVMGSHGRTGIRRVLLGSVAEKVVRHAKCPVFVARKRT